MATYEEVLNLALLLSFDEQLRLLEALASHLRSQLASKSEEVHKRGIIPVKSWFMAGSQPRDYQPGIDTSVTYKGKNSGYLKSRVVEPRGFGTMMQMFKADNYRSKRMRLSAYVKSEAVEDWAGLWMRIDGPEQNQPLGFDNMQNRPIKGTNDWQEYAVVLDVPQESINIAFGILLEGKGQVWLSGVQFEEVGKDVPTTSINEERTWPDKPENLDFSE